MDFIPASVYQGHEDCVGFEDGKIGLYPETLKIHYQKPGGMKGPGSFGILS